MDSTQIAITNISDNDTADAEVRAQVRAAMSASGMPARAVAKAMGIAPSTLSEWLNGNYKADGAALAEKARGWLQDRSSASSRDSDFVETPTASRILSVLMYAKGASDMAVVYGGPGVGKTRTCRHFAESYPNVWIATMTPASATVVPALEEIAEAVGLRDIGGGARKLSRAIRSKVKGAPGGLIIIDEAQHLSIAAIEELRAIHDATGVGVALVGNEVVYARLTGGTRAAHFAQIFSRLGMRLPIRRPEAGDVAALAARWGVQEPGAIGLLQAVAAKPGALRAATKLMRLAAASSAGGPITTAQLRSAIAHLGAEV